MCPTWHRFLHNTICTHISTSLKPPSFNKEPNTSILISDKFTLIGSVFFDNTVQILHRVFSTSYSERVVWWRICLKRYYFDIVLNPCLKTDWPLLDTNFLIAFVSIIIMIINIKSITFFINQSITKFIPIWRN